MAVERSARERRPSLVSTAALGGVASTPSVPHPHSTSQQEVRLMAVQAHAPRPRAYARRAGPEREPAPGFQRRSPSGARRGRPRCRVDRPPDHPAASRLATAIEAAVDQAVLPTSSTRSTRSSSWLSSASCSSRRTPGSPCWSGALPTGASVPASRSRPAPRPNGSPLSASGPDRRHPPADLRHRERRGEHSRGLRTDRRAARSARRADDPG